MPQDAFTIKYVAKELSALLCGGKISKITQPNKDLLTFIIYTRTGMVKLEICLSAKGCRVNLTEGDAPAPQVAPGFCMLLRKHLQNAEILKVECVDGERIVAFDFYCTSEFERAEMTLYAEIMGKYSNAVLVKEGVIVGALKTTAIGENTKRVLFTGTGYVLPEPQDKLQPDDLAGIDTALKYAGGDIAKFISEKIRGVSYSTALEIAETYGEKITAGDIVNYLTGGEISPCVTFIDGAPSDFKVRSVAAHKKEYFNVLSAQTAYYAAINAKNAFEEKKKKLAGALNSAVKKQEKRLAQDEQKLFDCKDAELVKLKGELITANIYAVQRGMDSFEAVNYYDEKSGKIKIALDRSLSPADNAQKYYKRYAKLKRTAENVERQKAETLAALDYLKSIDRHICAAESLDDLEETEEELKIIGLIKSDGRAKKKVDKPLPFRTFEVENFKIIAGRNNIQNDRLLKALSRGDIWLHTQNYHSSHVGIIREGREVPESVLRVAAEICAYYSDGKEGVKIPVDYTERAYVKKPPKAAAGFVIYTDFKTVTVDPNPHADLKKE